MKKFKMQQVGYLMATWGGLPRRNPCTEYLRYHLQKLSELKHNCDIFPIRPAGEYFKEFYRGLKVMDRPKNDRGYGSWIWAAKELRGKYSHFILVEDDYIPVQDDFNIILLEMLGDADYLCGKFGADSPIDRPHPQFPMGIIKAEVLENMPENPFFHQNGTEDGQEFLIWGDLLDGCKIKDYAKEYSIPFWDKTLREMGNKDKPILFAPYQLLEGRAFNYDVCTKDTPKDYNSPYLKENW